MKGKIAFERLRKRRYMNKWIEVYKIRIIKILSKNRNKNVKNVIKNILWANIEGENFIVRRVSGEMSYTGLLRVKVGEEANLDERIKRFREYTAWQAAYVLHSHCQLFESQL